MEYARANRASIARRLVDTSVYPREECPLTVFMAGSPGAGKTEVSKALVASIEAAMPVLPDGGAHVLRIDPDEFRPLFPGYTGANSSTFQAAVIKVLEKVVDRAFDKSVAFLLDGTLSSIDVARTNIRRALARNRVVQIVYVYQHPERAWQFVQDRELTEGRNIPLETFVAQFLAARRNVHTLKAEFGDDISVDVLIQAADGLGRVEIDVAADMIDQLLPETYDEATLLNKLSSPGDENESRI